MKKEKTVKRDHHRRSGIDRGYFDARAEAKP